VYRPVHRIEILDTLIHIRDLYRRVTPSDERTFRAHERREAAIKDLLSNLPRTNEHPTLKTLLEIAETCGLTLDGAHRLFGYDLGQILDYDLRLNGGRTHIECPHRQRHYVSSIRRSVNRRGRFSEDVEN
jgi:hypothetical protein